MDETKRYLEVFLQDLQRMSELELFDKEILGDDEIGVKLHLLVIGVAENGLPVFQFQPPTESRDGVDLAISQFRRYELGSKPNARQMVKMLEPLFDGGNPEGYDDLVREVEKCFPQRRNGRNQQFDKHSFTDVEVFEAYEYGWAVKSDEDKRAFLDDVGYGGGGATDAIHRSDVVGHVKIKMKALFDIGKFIARWHSEGRFDQHEEYADILDGYVRFFEELNEQVEG